MYNNPYDLNIDDFIFDQHYDLSYDNTFFFDDNKKYKKSKNLLNTILHNMNSYYEEEEEEEEELVYVVYDEDEYVGEFNKLNLTPIKKNKKQVVSKKNIIGLSPMKKKKEPPVFRQHRQEYTYFILNNKNLNKELKKRLIDDMSIKLSRFMRDDIKIDDFFKNW